MDNPTKIIVATCTLNQWALDFEGNTRRILRSIHIAHERGALYRLGPELEVCGYGCNDHFHEVDTFNHSWDALAMILSETRSMPMVIDIGMPVLHHGVRYNCRVFCHLGRILLIRPKLHLANDGNYREGRFFTPWTKIREVEQHSLPPNLAKLTGQSSVPFGDAIVEALDTSMGSETCEELFTSQSPHIAMGLDGVEIFSNGSGSHHELRKLNRRIELISTATSKVGGVYLYANQKGCDGERVYYDGSALICLNGKVLAQSAQFSLADVEVITAVIDLNDVRSFRASNGTHGLQAATAARYPRVSLSEQQRYLCTEKNRHRIPTEVRTVRYHEPSEEISLGPACWLWDYLRRSGAAGFLLPLSGGIDSCSTAVLVYSMANLVVKAVQEGDETVLQDARRIAAGGDPNYVPTDPKEFCNRIFHTLYMGTENSSKETRDRAKNLADEIGSYHVNMSIDTVITALVALFVAVTTKTPRFRVHGGTNSENLALQNIQARLRMVIAYMFAQLLPWVRNNHAGSLLVLGSANVDECLRGYMTKYDCSSADINPIGGISKRDLRAFIAYAAAKFNLQSLPSFLNAVPTAELEPITESHIQTDEADMGMTYDELSEFGRLRKIEHCGPVSMFQKLSARWGSILSPLQVAEKVKRFFYYYSINRHKMTIVTPSYHAESYSPDDNRFDLRPFLYNARWTWQFSAIDQQVQQLQQQQQ